jgi:hypothetical protein
MFSTEFKFSTWGNSKMNAHSSDHERFIFQNFALGVLLLCKGVSPNTLGYLWEVFWKGFGALCRGSLLRASSELGEGTNLVSVLQALGRSVFVFIALCTYLSMKEGCLFVLFCFVCTDEIQWTGMLQIVFLISSESSGGGGWVHPLGFMMFGLVVQKFLNIEWFFHWKLN